MADKDCQFALNIINCIAILLLSFIILFTAPMIKGNSYINEYNNNNSGINIDCSKYSILLENEIDEKYEKIIKKEKNKCQRFSVMAGMEFTVLLLNFSFIISYIFILIIFYDQGNLFERLLGFYLGILPSIIMFVFNLVYVIYNGIIFTQDSPSFLDYKELMTISLLNSDYGSLNQLYPKNGILKTNEEGAFAKYNIYTDKYEFLYPPKDEKDIYGIYAKFNDFYKKQYNYNKELYIKKYIDFNFELMHCESEDIQRIKDGINGKIYYQNSHGILTYCQFLYSYKFGDSTYNKALYNRWCLSLIFMLFVSILHFCNIFIELSLIV